MLPSSELESGGRQSIRVDCGPVANLLNEADVELDDDDGDDDDGDDVDNDDKEQRNYDEPEQTITTPPYYELTDSTERTVTSPNWNSVTSLVPAAETSAVMTTASVTSSHHVISDYSSSSSLNLSCKFKLVLVLRLQSINQSVTAALFV